MSDPSKLQTQEEIAKYYKVAAIGDDACIRTTYGGILEFKMSIIEREAKKSRVVLRHNAWNGGFAWYVDGRNCVAPGGKARLVIPTPEIKEWIKDHVWLRIGR
jgi:hypothetical protein